MGTFVVLITVTSAQSLLYFSARLQRATHNTHGRTPKEDKKNTGNETTRRVQVQENEEQIILTAKEEHTRKRTKYIEIMQKGAKGARRKDGKGDTF